MGVATAESATGQGPLRSILVLGGGTAGWLAASILARALPGTGMRITVVESPDIGTVGVGEATIPPILDLLKFLSIDEADFCRHTKATYKLGIRFNDWLKPGHRYWHPFGTFGATINRRPFFHAWQRLLAAGETPRFTDFSLTARLAEENRFRRAEPGGAAAGLRYALHFDAGLVATYLAAYATRLGVERVSATVRGATRSANGGIEALVLEDGTSRSADLYIDCSGFRGVLIEQTLGTGYLDWQRWLPCDRAVAAPTSVTRPRPPYTEASARPAGWRWRIPLVHRTGNGYVYSSAHVSDEAALADFLGELGTAPEAEPRVLKFTAGRRRLAWHHNVIAVGLASGFLEPLESTSIHLAASSIYHLLEHFPDRGFAQANVDAYNAAIADEIERIRDFIVLHYCLTERDDTAFWRDCRAAEPPASLAERIALYRETGRVRPRAGELFTDLSWFYILDGMQVRPARHDPLIDVVPPAQFKEILRRLAAETDAAARSAVPHDSLFDAASARPAKATS